MAQMNGEDGFSRERYERAAAKYRPRKTCVLFVAEAPPSSLDRYFYFEDVKRQDALWVELMKAVFGTENWTTTRHERRRKRDWLLKFQKNGYQLIDAVKEPLDCGDSARVERIGENLRELILEIKQIDPAIIVLIKATVHKALFQQLRAAGLPVADCRLPFPGNGQQKKFQREFPRAILRHTP
jgi:hypothetical protein